MIDRIRQELEQRLKQLVDESDRVRQALAALARDEQSNTSRQTRSRARANPAAGQPTVATAGRARRTGRGRSASSRKNSSPGATRSAVLAALADGGAMTAAQVADKAGLPRPTVSTTLSRLARAGELEKADRGYRLPPGTSAAAG